MDYYVQCKIVCGNKVDTRFIQEHLAKENLQVKFDEVDGIWIVKEVYKESRKQIKDINRSQVFKAYEYAGRKSYKDKSKK